LTTPPRLSSPARFHRLIIRPSYFFFSAGTLVAPNPFVPFTFYPLPSVHPPAFFIAFLTTPFLLPCENHGGLSAPNSVTVPVILFFLGVCFLFTGLTRIVEALLFPLACVLNPLFRGALDIAVSWPPLVTRTTFFASKVTGHRLAFFLTRHCLACSVPDSPCDSILGKKVFCTLPFHRAA